MTLDIIIVINLFHISTVSVSIALNLCRWRAPFLRLRSVLTYHYYYATQPRLLGSAFHLVRCLHSDRWVPSLFQSDYILTSSRAYNVTVWEFKTPATMWIPVPGRRILSLGGTTFVPLGGTLFRFRQAPLVLYLGKHMDKLSWMHRVLLRHLAMHFFSFSLEQNYFIWLRPPALYHTPRRASNFWKIMVPLSS